MTTNRLADLLKLKQEREAAKKREQRANQSVLQEENARVQNLALKDHLRPYQQASVLQALSNFSVGRNTLDASSMGLGKTRMAASFLMTAKVNKTLWITAKNLIIPTINQLKPLGLTLIPVDFHSITLLLDVFKDLPVAFITNYESLGSKTRGKPFTDQNKIKWDLLIIDEVSKLKGGANPSPTQIWKNTKELIEKFNPYLYFISGTPVENHPRELWAYLHLFDPNRFPKLYQFENTFCDPTIRGELKLNNEKLYDLLRSYIIRNTYETAKIDLPKVQEITVPCSLEDGQVKTIYTRLMEEFAIWLESQEGKEITVTMLLEQLLRQRQILSTGESFTFSKQNPISLEKQTQTMNLEGPFPKLDVAEGKVFELLNDEEQVIVFSCFNEPLKTLKKRLDFLYECAIINGETKNTNQIVEDFQQKKIQVLLINKLSGSHGLNLQKCNDWPGGASHVIHLDRWWNPAREDQANARVVRMNTNAPVFIYYLHVEETVDDFMLSLLNNKRQFQENTDTILITQDIKSLLK